MSESSGRVRLWMHMLGSIDYAVIKGLPVLFRCYSFKNGVSNDRCRVVAYHTASVAGACPLWKEFIFAGYIRKALLNLLIYRRIYKIEQREESSESVPETGIGVEIAVADLSVVWAIMNRIAVLVNFV